MFLVFKCFTCINMIKLFKFTTLTCTFRFSCEQFRILRKYRKFLKFISQCTFMLYRICWFVWWLDSLTKILRSNSDMQNHNLTFRFCSYLKSDFEDTKTLFLLQLEVVNFRKTSNRTCQVNDIHCILTL